MASDANALEREIEETRERLSATIDQLVHRSSPKNIARREAASARAFFVAPDGAPRQDNIIKVAGGVVGVIVLFAVIRKIAK